jgi:D-alanine-D-alanine ligase
MNKIDFSKIHIAVLMGGFSSEREVSLNSGRKVVEALRSQKCRVSDVDVRDLEFSIPADTDVAFIALHGTGGEDGVIQSILEKKGLPFTGSDSETSRLAFDKVAAKEVFRQKGLSTPADVVIHRNQWKGSLEEFSISCPCVVKPSCEGSSIGVFIVKEKEELASAIDGAFKKGDTLLIEDFIEGREFTVGILGEKPLPVIEIRPKNGWFDYKNKYTAGATEEIVPAPISEKLAIRLQNDALAAHRVLGCRDLSRSDFRMDAKENIYLLEVNTIPGMTETSLLPQAAAAAGINFPHLCLELIGLALNRKEKIK